MRQRLNSQLTRLQALSHVEAFRYPWRQGGLPLAHHFSTEAGSSYREGWAEAPVPPERTDWKEGLLQRRFSASRILPFEGLRVGQAVNGVVIGIQPYGLRVELLGPGGNIYDRYGMLHISKVSRPRNQRLAPADLFRLHFVGERLTLYVWDMDVSKGQIDLNIRPPERPAHTFSRGELVASRLVSVMPYGAYFSVPGFPRTALMHFKGPEDREAAAAWRPGQDFQMMVLRVDVKHNLTLGLPPPPQPADVPAAPAAPQGLTAGAGGEAGSRGAPEEGASEAEAAQEALTAPGLGLKAGPGEEGKASAAAAEGHAEPEGQLGTVALPLAAEDAPASSAGVGARGVKRAGTP